MVLQHIQVFEDQFSSYELWIPTNPSDGADIKAEPAMGSVKTATKNNIFNVSINLCSIQSNSLVYSPDWHLQHIFHCHWAYQELHHCNMHPHSDSTFFAIDSKTNDKNISPDFSASFLNNQAWYSHMISYIWQNGPKCDANLLAEIIQAQSDAEILSRVSTVFHGFSDKYKAYWKDKPKHTSSTAVAVTTQCEIESKQSAHWHSCKVAVSGLMFSPTMLLTIWQKLKCHKIARQAANEDIQSDNWTWFFQVLYQSSDKSTQEDSLDPDTNIGENVLVSSVHKPWVHHQPTYQLLVVSLSVYYMKWLLIFLQVNAAAAHLNDIVRQAAKDLAKKGNKKTGSAVHPVTIGFPKEHSLLAPLRTNKIIPLAAVSLLWLSAHPDENVVLFREYWWVNHHIFT